MLTVITERLGDVVTLRCAGRIVRGQETAILCAAVQQHRRHLVLDLAGVDAIDAAGVGLLVSLQAAGIYLQLLNPSKPVREVLRMTHLDSVFEIQSTEDGMREVATRESSDYVGRVPSGSQTVERMAPNAGFD